MELKISVSNIELNTNAEKYIQKKFKRLERHLRSISEAKLEVRRTSARSRDERVVAQMTLIANGYTLRGQERALDLFTAIDAVTDVMDRQIDRFKGKMYRTARAKKSGPAGSIRPIEALAGDADEARLADDAREETSNFVRTKRFRMIPMTMEEAVTEMDLLNHGFYFFFNIDTQEYNVIYRRHDGDYGVIEPVLE